MSQYVWNTVESLFTEALHPADPVLEAALEYSAQGGLPAIQVSPTQGKMLQLWARTMGARSILEIGTLGGYSTIWLARALPPDGTIVTLETDPQHAAVARANLERAGFADRVEVWVGAALDSLPGLEGDRRTPFDLVFIDADKENNVGYFEWALRLTQPGSLIIIDNVVRDGAVIDPQGDSRVQGVRRALARVGAEPRVSATVLQTVGSKGYDGMLLAVVN